MREKYKLLIEDLHSLADGHEKDRSNFTATKIREAIEAIKELSEEAELHVDDRK